MRGVLVLIIFLSFFQVRSFGQAEVIINDNIGILTDEVRNLVSDQLWKNRLKLEDKVDFDLRCSYYFVNLFIRNKEAYIHVLDCNSNSIGGKNLGYIMLSGSPHEKSVILSFAIVDVIKRNLPNEGWQWDPYNRVIVEIDREQIPDTQQNISNEHSSRYFFAPTAHNISKGELYYNSIYFLLHDIQYGITKRFSFGMGTTVAAIPFYFTPKLTLFSSDRSSFAIGNIMILGTWGIDFYANLSYGIYTYGKDNSFSFGGGLISSSDNEFTAKSKSPAFNLSGVMQISDYVYAVSENYAFRLNFNHSAEFGDPADPGYMKEDFIHEQTFLFGITGLRFVNKRKNVICWQIGLTYIFDFLGEVPDQYTANGWISSVEEGGFRFYAVPTLNYTHKFGKKF